MNILAIIPARGGSKGIKNKNIRDFGGKPLIAHTIDHAKQSKQITKIVVSTESQEIAEVAKQHGAEVPFLRPKEMAEDKSPIMDALVHMIENLDQRPDYIVLLQPTSPFRLPSDIDAALDLMFEREADAVVSVCQTEQLLFTKDERSRLSLISSNEFLKSSNRQELETTYKLDGCMIYGIKTDVLLEKKTFLVDGVVGYEIPRWRAIDLDEPEDFVVGEELFAKLNTISNKINNFE